MAVGFVGGRLERVLRQLLLAASSLERSWFEAEACGWLAEQGLFDAVQGAFGENIDTVDDVVEQALQMSA